MKRRSFVKTMGVLGLSSAGVTTVAASQTEATASKYMLGKRALPVNKEWDVIVVGGGPSGCAAAIAAAREGAKTLLVEATGMLGGMGTAGFLNAWCPFTDGEKIIYKGIAEKIFQEAKKGVPHISANTNDWVPINPEQLKIVYDNAVSEAGVSVLFFTNLASVEMSGKDTVDAIIVSNKAGLTAYQAKVFVDCTGDGDLATWAGAGFYKGDAAGSVQAATLCFSVANIDMYGFQTDPPLHGNNPGSPIHKILKSGKYPLITDGHMNDKLSGPSCVAFNAGHLTDVDSTNPVSLSKGIMHGRKIVKQIHEGLVEFQPRTFASSYVAGTGALLGIRESRRIKCDYTFTVDDWVARRSFEDEIGRNSYYIDVHKKDAKQYPRYKKGESHGIPYRCLTPLGLKNVLVAGRCVSTDEYAFGSLRVMPPCLVTGEAAGTAAALSLKIPRYDVHHVDTRLLRKRLKEEGQLIL